MRFSLLNPRSVRHKTLSPKDLTVDQNIDVFAVIETWLSKETEEFTIRDLRPTGYECYNVSIRVSRVGGGIGVIEKTVFRLREKHPCIVTKFKSFEFMAVLLKHIPSSYLRLIIVYRPQTMGDGTSSTAKFFEEFPSLLEFLVTVPGSLLMGGDVRLKFVCVMS